MTIAPTPFETPIVAPDSYAAYRSASYLSVSQYRFAPTSVATQNGLVPGANDPGPASDSSLAQVIARASSMMDEHVFHRPDGSFAASLTVEQMSSLIKPDGSLTFLCNYKPLREVVGLSIGPTISSLTAVDQTTANNIQVHQKSFTLTSFCTGSPVAYFGPWPSVNGYVIGLYSYVSGWPHLFLAANAAADAETITVTPAVPGDSTIYAVHPGTPLVIKDGTNTETVVVQSISGNVLTLVSPLQNGHTVPAGPDEIPVTALPSGVEEAAISMTNYLLKTRGFRAQQLPGSVGNASPGMRQVMARAGALGDWDNACRALHPYRVAFLHS